MRNLVLPNRYPYNELLLDGKLTAHSHGWNLRYRGRVFLYTSAQNEKILSESYNLGSKVLNPNILVAKANLVDVRPFTEAELYKIISELNPKVCDRDIYDYVYYGMRHNRMVYPKKYGFFFENVQPTSSYKHEWPNGYRFLKGY